MNAPLSNAPARVKSGGFQRWHKRVLAFCLIVFAFELGVFLLVFPWLRVWGMNWVPVHAPHLAALWMSRYFRGLVSGLGLLNIYIALVEAARQLRSVFAPGA